MKVKSCFFSVVFYYITKPFPCPVPNNGQDALEDGEKARESSTADGERENETAGVKKGCGLTNIPDRCSSSTSASTHSHFL